MAIFNTCSNCNVSLIKRNQNTVAIVCPKCGVLNSNDNIEVPFSIAEEDMSPICIGAEGAIEGKKFVVTGRLKFNFSSGYRNQWSVTFSDGSSKWLSECYGYYAVYSKAAIGASQARFRNLKAGNLLEFPGGEEYVVETIRKNQKYSGEGELHELPLQQVDIFQIEFSNDKGVVIVVNILEKSAYDIYMGNYYEFDTIKFSKLRESAEWK